MDKLKAASLANTEYILNLRRHFHMYPETGGEEQLTQKRILTELTTLGISARPAGGTGVIADVQGSSPGKTIALRTDIDALPIQDELDRPYRSRHDGKCHACGHDAHIAMALGAAKTLQSLRQELTGNIRLIFQPSEEKFPGGAESMIKAGALAKVSAIIGAHVWQPFPAGKLGISYSRTMASPDEFTITIQGKGGHSSMPHQTIDPLFLAAQIIIAGKALMGTAVNPLEQAVISFGMCRSGEVFNIIPDTAEIKGTIRTFNKETRNLLFTKLEKIISALCSAAGATYKLEQFLGFPPVINDPAIARLAADAGCEILGKDNVFEMEPVMAGEDFSFYLEKVPGAFIFIGAGSSDFPYPHHHPKFDIDESILSSGSAILALTAVKLLQK